MKFYFDIADEQFFRQCPKNILLLVNLRQWIKLSLKKKYLAFWHRFQVYVYLQAFYIALTIEESIKDVYKVSRYHTVDLSNYNFHEVFKTFRDCAILHYMLVTCEL